MRIASTFTPATFAPSGEPEQPRAGTEAHAVSGGHDATSGRFPSEAPGLTEGRTFWPGQVFGLVDVKHINASPTVRRFPATRASAYGEGRFHTPLRGSAGIGPYGPHRLPFSSHPFIAMKG